MKYCVAYRLGVLKMIKPIVSVIIPAFYCSDYIEMALESVLKQRVPLEILVISDAQDDKLDNIMEKYCQLKNVIYLKNNVNLGVAETRNIGVRASSGEYVAFLDADDWWKPNKLEKQLLLLERTESVLCYTGRELVNDDGSKCGKIIHVKERINYQQLLRHNSIVCSSVMIRKNVLIEFPMKCSKLHEDYITWLSILEKYKYACGINEPLINYRLSKGGKSRNKIKSAQMTFGVYRYLGYSRWKAFLLTNSHLLHGIIKYTVKK